MNPYDKDYSIEAEQAVLGSILLNNNTLERVNHLQASDFFIEEHRALWKIIMDTHAQYGVVDMVSVSEMIDQKGLAKNTGGGLPYVGLLVQRTPTTANAHVYAQIVKERSLMRKAKEAISKNNFDDIKAFTEEFNKAQTNISPVPSVQIKRFSELQTMETPPTEWVIEGLIPAKSRNLLAAKPKAGKSWLALDMALSVASGGDFLGKKTQQGDVLYLSLEDNDSRMKKRIETIKGQFNERVHYACECPNMSDGGIDVVINWCKSVENPKLIIIDTLAKFRPESKGKNLYEDDYNSTQALLRITEQFNCSVLLVHHTRKMKSDDPMDTVSGSLGLTGGIDNLFVLERGRNSNVAQLHVIGRDIEEDKPLNLSFDEGKWTHLSDFEKSITPERAKLALLILGNYSIKEMSGILEKQENAVYKMLHDMCEAGIINRKSRGQYLVNEEYSEVFLKQVIKAGKVQPLTAGRPQTQPTPEPQAKPSEQVQPSERTAEPQTSPPVLSKPTQDTVRIETIRIATPLPVSFPAVLAHETPYKPFFPQSYNNPLMPAGGSRENIQRGGREISG